MATTLKLETTFTLPSDREIRMTRSFKAPRTLVWDVYTQPEHIRNWWGPREMPLTVCDVDLRVGGKWRYVAQGPDGMVVAFSGEFTEIDRPDRLVNTEIFEDFPDNSSLVTTTFQEADGLTTVISTSSYESQEVRDIVLSTGMEDGAAESWQRIAEILERLQ